MSPITASTPGPSSDETIRRRRLLGAGLRADLVDRQDLARDIGLRGTPGGVDLDVVEGIDALTQDLEVGLTTLRGSDPLNARFGFLGLGALADRTPPVIAREALRSAVAQLVAADPRVRRITELTVSAPAAGSGALAVTVTFDAISDAGGSLTVTGLGPQPIGEGVQE
jgi:phage baseplate assembly protein W